MSPPRRPRSAPRPGDPRAFLPSANHPDDLRIRCALLRWFADERRDLPWRENRDPYRVWVSEIMLQQTQVSSVIPYYRRFLAAFPTVEHLARASLERVLKLWSGLGYYRRARHLHAAARMVVGNFNGRFPRDLNQACGLPGVGRYTAGAVLSIAYDRPHVALDGNVARVLARLEGRKGCLADSGFRGLVERRLEGLLSPRRPGDFNQAMMELGQTICLPRSPRCPECPVGRWCYAGRLGTPEAFPSPRPRRAAEQHHLAAALVSRGCGAARQVLLIRGLDDGLMEDLWNFPSALGASRAEAFRRLEARLDGLAPGGRVGGELARVRHNITYRNIDARLYRAEGAVKANNNLRWLKISQVGAAAVSELVRKIIRAAGPSLSNGARHAGASRREAPGPAERLPGQAEIGVSFGSFE